MKRISTFILFLFSMFFLSENFAQSPKTGPRPFQDFSLLPENAYEKGFINIKLTPQAAALLTHKMGGSTEEGQFFGIPELDKLCADLKIISIKPFYYGCDAIDAEFAERHSQWGFNRWYALESADTTHTLDAVFSLANLKQWVEVAEPELISILHTWIPTDPYFKDQWHYHNTGQNGGTAGADIKLADAWDIEKGNPAILVNIVDGGIDTTNTDLLRNLWKSNNEHFGFNFTANSKTITRHRHGTHVAGTVGAINNNGIGVSGVAGGDTSANSGIRMINSQIFSNAVPSARIADIVNAFLYGADKASVISQNSWGTSSPGSYSAAYLDAIDYFIEYGGGSYFDKGLVVFSAGNSNQIWPHYPGAYSRVISVASTNNKDQKSYFSNYGPWVDVSAPGGETRPITAGGILSTDTISGSYIYMQGTSMACPHVSGVAALIASKGMNRLSTDDIRSVMVNEVDDIYGVNTSYSGQLGKGRLNALKSLMRTVELINGKLIAAPSAFTVNNPSCDSFSLSWINNANNDTVMVAVATKGKALFGIPEGYYVVGDSIEGGGRIIFRGRASSLSYAFSDSIAQYLGFKIWSIDSGQYSKGVFDFHNYEPCDNINGNIRYVKVGGTGNGSSWANASGDLQKMINYSKSGDSIFVAAGTYKPIRTIFDLYSITYNDRHSSFVPKAGITLLGGFPNNNNNATLVHRDWGNNETILSGNIGAANQKNDNSYNVVWIVDTGITIDGFIIRDGNADTLREYGGGVFVRGGSLYLNNSIIKDNQAKWGGGLYSTSGGKVEIENSEINQNLADNNGGGLYNSGGTMNLKNVTFYYNIADYGASIYNVTNGVLNLDQVEFENAYAYVSGAGIFNSGGHTEISNTVFINGQAGWGGGVYNSGEGYIKMEDVDFLINDVGNYGGAIMNNGKKIDAQRIFLKGNTANYGGGIANYKGVFYLNNSTIDSNMATRGAGIYNRQDSVYVYKSILKKNNLADYGGGIYTNSTSYTGIKNVVFDGNEANTYGGGIYNLGDLQVDSGYFTGGLANSGAGIFNHSADKIVEVLNSFFIKNDIPYGSGSGFYNWSGNPIIINSVFKSNKNLTAAIYVNGGYPKLLNVTVSNNRGNNTGGIHRAYGNISVINSIIGNNHGVMTEDDQFGIPSSSFVKTIVGDTLIHNSTLSYVGTSYDTTTLMPFVCGPAVNVGINDSLLSNLNTDIAGNPRVYGGTVDLGAYEVQKGPSVLTGTHTVNICIGQSYTFNGQTYSTSNNTAKDTLLSIEGCDSIVTLNLTVSSSLSSIETVNICEGSSYTFKGGAYTTSNYSAKDTFTAVGGCDSIVTLNLTVSPIYSDTINARICQGESYVYRNVTYTTSQMLRDTFTSAGGCDSIIVLYLLVDAMPSATVSSNGPICTGQDLILSASGGQSYVWAGPNSFSSSTANPTISKATMAANGTYRVVVSGNNTSCKDTAEIVVTVIQGPDGTASSNAPLCVGATLNLSASGGDDYSWTGPNNFTSNLSNPSISNATTAATGSYSVAISHNLNSCVDTQTLDVLVDETPSVEKITYTQKQDESYDFVAVGVKGNVKYEWNFGDNSPLGNVAAPNHKFSTAGTYRVRLVVYNDCGADATTVTINHKTSIDDVSPEQHLLSLYPNPAKDNVILKNESTKEMESISIVNTLGQIISHLPAQNDKKHILDVKHLPAGVYHLKVQFSDGQWTVKRLEIIR